MNANHDAEHRRRAAELNLACQLGALDDAIKQIADLAPIELLTIMLNAGFMSAGLPSDFKPATFRRQVADACSRKIDGWTWSFEGASP